MSQHLSHLAESGSLAAVPELNALSKSVNGVSCNRKFHTKPRDCLGERLRNDLFCVEWDVKP